MRQRPALTINAAPYEGVTQMAKANGSKQKRSIMQRALLAIFGSSSTGFVGELEQAKQRVENADFGELTAGELQGRMVDGSAEPEDALACIEDVFSVLRLERGDDAEAAFLRKLQEFMTHGTDEDIIPSAKPMLPESLADAEKLGDGVAKWLEDVLRFRQAESEKDGQLIDYMRRIVSGKYGPEAIKSFRMALFSMMIRKEEAAPALERTALDIEQEAIAERAEKVREALMPKFDPANYPGTLDTEKDGRLYAVALLNEIQRRADKGKEGEFSAIPSTPDQDPGDTVAFRTGPQSSLIVDAFDQIYAVNEDTRRGFFQIITDYLGQANIGTYDPEVYEKWEARGLFSETPEPTPPAANVVPIRPGMYVPPEANPLQTQRDGRLYAMDVLDLLDEVDVDEAALNPVIPANAFGEGDTWKPYRSGPQPDQFYKGLSRLFKEGTEEAVKGFAAVFTAALAGDIGRSGDFFREDERAGLNQDLGTPGSAAHPPEGVKDGKVLPEAAFNADAHAKEQPKGVAVGASRKQTKAEIAVSKKLAYLQLALDQLHDIGKRLEKSPYSHFTTMGAVKGIATQMLSALVECQNRLPKGHPAKNEVKKAIEAANDLIRTAQEWVEAHEAGKEPSNKLQGRAMVALVVDAAQAIERAEIACGENNGTGGWLNDPGMDPNAVRGE